MSETRKAVATAYFTDANGKSYAPGDKFDVPVEEISMMHHDGHARLATEPAEPKKEQG